MLKVSFKESADSHCKYVCKVGKVTTVMLRGILEVPDFWYLMPYSIRAWIAGQSLVKLSLYDGSLLVHSSGISKCREGDKYNSLLGERLAEARAKLNIYKFMAALCDKLIAYYTELLFGKTVLLTKSEKLEGIAKARDKYHRLCIHEEEHIENLLRQ